MEVDLVICSHNQLGKIKLKKTIIMKSKKEILELINSEQALVLHFYTMDCKKHVENKKSLRQLKNNHKACSLKTLNVLIDKQLSLVDELDIDGLPSTVLFLGGKEKWRRAGGVPEEKILRELKDLIAVA